MYTNLAYMMIDKLNRSAVYSNKTSLKQTTVDFLQLGDKQWEISTANSSFEHNAINSTRNVSLIPDCELPDLCSSTESLMTTPAIIGTSAAASIILIAIVISIFVVIYRRKRKKHDENKTSLWDDNMTLSYINPHIDMSKELDTDLASLDDDSFLNSLDNMNFVNLWSARTTRGIKHTKF